MKAFWIFIITSFVHLSFCYGYVSRQDDYYDRDYLVDQFRKHYDDRREPIFRSRDAVYRPVSHPKNGRNDYHQDYAKLYPHKIKQQWDPRGFVPEAELGTPELDRSTNVANDAIEDMEIDRLRGVAQQSASLNEKRESDEKFKVTTRAQAKQMGSHNSEVPQAMHNTSVAPTSDIYFIALVAGCSAAAVFGVMAAGFCWYKFQKNAKASAEAEYPAYGVTGPNKEHISPSSGDRKLAQSAQMYHYQHQKQQMIAMEKTNGDRQISTSDLDSEEENEEGDYTVYECPGLAPTGEMEVKNPLFQDEPTPASPPVSAKPTNDGEI